MSSPWSPDRADHNQQQSDPSPCRRGASRTPQSTGTSPSTGARCRPGGRVGAVVERQFVPVAESERELAIETLVSAFEDDPVERWLYPDDVEYRRHFPAFVAAFGGAAFRDQTVWRLGAFEAVAFW